MSQAFFKRVLVTEEGVVGWEYNDPFATLMTAHALRRLRVTEGGQTQEFTEDTGYH